VTWSGRRVLVTGAGGFIGSHLTERLVEAGASVTALVHYNALGSRGWLDGSAALPAVRVVAGDIVDRDSVREAMHGAEVVFHLAALIAIPYSYHAPSSYVRINVEGTLNVLQAARELQVERLVHTSTSEVYGTAQYAPIDEGHPLQGQSPYSASKIGADKMVEAFHLSFGLPVVTVRPFNTYGPRQSLRAVLPTIVSQCLAGGPIRLGNLKPTRDLSFVSDTVDGFIRAAMTPGVNGAVFNIGSGTEISIEDLARLIAGLMGCSPRIESEEVRERPAGSEVKRLLADNRRAIAVLGWMPSVSLSDGLARTIAWIAQHQERYAEGVLTL
jgi:NAD dependent epimerase/dehydratase